MKRRHGFTLIELVVTMVVIGVLAGGAMVYQSNNRQKVETNEARSILSMGYAGYCRLLAEEEGINPLTWQRMGMTDPNTMPNRLFTYSIRPNAANPNRLEATRGVTVTGCGAITGQRLRIRLTDGRLTEVLT